MKRFSPYHLLLLPLLALLPIVQGVVTNNIPISGLPLTTNVLDSAQFPLIQPYPGRTTNDTFRSSVQDLFRGRGTGTFTNIYVTNLTVISNLFLTNVTVQEFNTTNIIDQSVTYITNSFLVISNTTVTINGTNVATINPTVGRVPYNVDGVNFGDSALFYIDPTTVGATEIDAGLVAITNLANNAFVITKTIGGIDGVLTNGPAITDLALWTNSGGYLQPVDLTVPLFWTNVVAFGATTAVLERSSNNLQFTNNAADVKLGVVNQSGKTISLEAQSSSAVGIASGGSPSSLFLRNGSDQVALFSGIWEPGTDMSVGLGDVTSARWNGAAFGGTTYISGFVDTTNYSRLAVSHTGTNGAVLFDSQAAGSAGVSRPFNFTGSDVRISGFPLNGIGGVSPLAVAHTSECYWTNFHFTAIAAGTNSVFTVPSGYRLFLRGLIVFPATNSTTVYPGVSISGTDYRTGIVASAGTNGNTLQTVYIYEPGESVVIYTSGLLNNVMGSGLLFTNTLPIKTVKLNSFSVGNNTVYTVPASTYAIAANVGAPPPFNFSFINGTASTIHRKLYLVPSGGSVDSSTLIGEADVLSLGSGGVTITSQFVMFPGDSFVIDSDSSSAGQLAFLSIMECQ